MIVEWDEAKNRANAQKHGFQVTAAEEMFRHPLLVRPMREDYSENRWIGIGMIQGRVAFVAFAEDPNDTIRIISLRKA
ncbi:MAG: BrnT family toxin, partial [Terriglobales bacterium]